MPSTTASNLATPQQQVDALMLALRSADFWVSGHLSDKGVHSITLYENNAGRVSDQCVRFEGTQDECLDQLIAYQVAERLAG